MAARTDGRIPSRPAPALRRLGLLCVALALVGSALARIDRAHAATVLPPGFAESVVVAQGLVAPDGMSWSPDGRLFVSLGRGRVVVVSGGQLLPTPFVDLTAAVDSSGDRGVIGVTFDPSFATNHWVYVYYTALLPAPHQRVSRFTESNGIAVPGSEVIVWESPNLQSGALHNGGTIHFGPDGKLYISTGDNVVPANSQSMTTTLGKMLRINADGTIPPDNPFYGSATGPNRAIWALGLRNPYTWNFSASGEMFIDDVGANVYEEINKGAPGANFGWPTVVGAAHTPPFVDPIFTYTHGSGANQGCATIGGAFYEPTSPTFPASYAGVYFASDYCGGWIKTVDPSNGNAVSDFASGLVNVVNVSLGPDGSIYYMSRPVNGALSSTLYRIAYVGTAPPSITTQPADARVAIGEPATFTVGATGSTPLAYQWLRNNVVIPGATSSSYATQPAAPTDGGASFSVSVTNQFGSATSSSAVLTVTANHAPVPVITAPAVGATYFAGKVVTFSATATDAEDQNLPASAFAWSVVFHHRMHTHDFMVPGPAGVKSGSFTVPASNFENDWVVWFRIYLTVTDSQGSAITTYRDILPQISGGVLQTSPPNLRALLNGTSYATDFVFSSVRLFQWDIGVLTPQTANGFAWVFDRWSDGGALTHTIAVPSGRTSFVAVMRRTGGSVGPGGGLSATYYDHADLTGSSFSRVDPLVCFSWKPLAGPFPTSGTYSVRWNGHVQAQFTGATQFSIDVDDGARLWINGSLVIDQWGPLAAPATFTSTPIMLTAGTKYSIRLEARQGSGRAGAMRLSWSSAALPRSIVPSSQLMP